MGIGIISILKSYPPTRTISNPSGLDAPFSKQANGSSQVSLREDGSDLLAQCVTPPGSRTVNTEPLPGSLITVTSPPIMRASLRVMASPSPVPPKR